ncbi:MAG: methionine synthase [Desulfurococcus sp.]|nr:methionine synthase [Desulfurococcus sp.]
MIRTSHVGSFPLPYTPGNIKRVIEDLASIGIDAPPYPQLRSFIDIYLEPLVGTGALASRNGFYFLRDPARLKDSVEVEPEIPEARVMAEAKARGVYKWLRAPVTGPFTLSSRIYIEDNIEGGLQATLLREKKLLEYITEYVRVNLKYLAGLGYNILFIDEPVLGVLVGRRRILLGYNVEEITSVINSVFEGLPGEHGIHVCGRISPSLLDILAGSREPQVLNFEFHDNPGNIELLDREVLQAGSKILAPGIASSKNPRVEEYTELKNLLLEIGSRVNWRIDLVSADCGFGGLAVEDGSPEKAYAIGLEKLKRIKRIVVEVVEELGV